MGGFTKGRRKFHRTALLVAVLALAATTIPMGTAHAAVKNVYVLNLGSVVNIYDYTDGSTNVFIGPDGTVTATVAGTQTPVQVDTFGCQTKTSNSVRCFNMAAGKEVPIPAWRVEMHNGDDVVWSVHASPAVMLGQEGNDFLIASTGAGDVLEGGAGRDALIVREAAPQFTPKKDSVDCGGGAGGDGEFDIFQVDALDVVSHCPAPDQQW